MSLYGLTAVRKDANGFVVSAVIQQADPKTRQWLGAASELDVGDIAAMIVMGDEVWSVFTAHDGSTLGPRVLAHVGAGGKDEIHLAEPVPGRTFDDLWLLGSV